MGAMQRRRRSRQRRELGQRLAAIVRQGRARLGLTMTQLAERAGISRQMVALVEGGSANPTLEVMSRLVDALGIRLELVERGPVAIVARVHDEGHARMSAYVERRLTRLGWLVAREVRIEDGRYLGWIDLLAYHPATRTLLVIEIKTRLADIGGLERTVDWYGRVAWSAARKLGWRPERVVRWVRALASDEVDAVVSAHRAVFATAFPSRAVAMEEGLSQPESMPAAPGLALIDPSSRRRSWLFRTRVDGRRTAAPYAGLQELLERRPNPRRH